jgi:DNA-directed RNA polymerase specialized sigma24 family protein
MKRSESSHLITLNSLTKAKRHTFDRDIATIVKESSRIHAVISNRIKKYHVECNPKTESVNAILSECYIRGVSAIKKGKEIKNIELWILKTSKNIILEATREKTKTLSKTVRLEDQEELQDTRHEHETEAGRAQKYLKLINTEISRLKPLDQEIFRLRSEGKSFSEIMKQFVSDGYFSRSSNSLQNTLTQRYHRSRKKIQARVHLKTID